MKKLLFAAALALHVAPSLSAPSQAAAAPVAKAADPATPKPTANRLPADQLDRIQAISQAVLTAKHAEAANANLASMRGAMRRLARREAEARRAALKVSDNGARITGNAAAPASVDVAVQHGERPRPTLAADDAAVRESGDLRKGVEARISREAGGRISRYEAVAVMHLRQMEERLTSPQWPQAENGPGSEQRLIFAAPDAPTFVTQATHRPLPNKR